MSAFCLGVVTTSPMLRTFRPQFRQGAAAANPRRSRIEAKSPEFSARAGRTLRAVPSSSRALAWIYHVSWGNNRAVLAVRHFDLSTGLAAEPSCMTPSGPRQKQRIAPRSDASRRPAVSLGVFEAGLIGRLAETVVRLPGATYSPLPP